MNERERLSREGVARREALLEELRPVVVRRGRRRVVARGAGRVAVVLFIAGGTVWAWSAASHPVVRPVEVVVVPQPVKTVPVAPDPAVGQSGEADKPVVAMVETMVGLAAAVEVRPEPVARATDADLLAALQDAGQEPGLVRVDGRVVLAGDLRP